MSDEDMDDYGFDMIWDARVSITGAHIVGQPGTPGLWDPRFRTWPQALRISRWRPATAYKRHVSYKQCRRWATSHPYFEGDLRTQRIQQTAAPSPTRQSCRLERWEHRPYLFNLAPFAWDADVDFPEPEVRFPSLADQSNHEFIPLVELRPDTLGTPTPDPLFGHTLRGGPRCPPCDCGTFCLRCRIHEYTGDYSDLFDLQKTTFALKAWIQEFQLQDAEELLTKVRHSQWRDSEMTSTRWKPARRSDTEDWRRCMRTSAYLTALLDRLPYRAKTLLAMAGGVRIPTWEWAHKHGGQLDDGNWHCLGYEIMHSTRSQQSRLTTQVCMIQDISNQDYATVYNDHLGYLVPMSDRNCFEKANAIDMLIGLGRITSRLATNQKTQLYDQTGDLENLSRFWEQILNRETHENHRQRDMGTGRTPWDEEDNTSGVADHVDGVRWNCTNRHDGRCPPNPIRHQVLTNHFVYKDSWPNRTGHTGYYGDALHRPI